MYEDEIYIPTRKNFEEDYTVSVLGFFKYTSSGEFIELPILILKMEKKRKYIQRILFFSQ